MGHTPQEVATLTGRLERSYKAQQRHIDRNEKEALNTYCKAATPAAVQGLLLVIPQLSTCTSTLAALPPVLGAQVVEVTSASVADDAAVLQAISNNTSTMHASNLGSSFEVYWQQLHRLLPDDASFLPTAPQMLANEPCEGDDDGEHLDMTDGPCAKYGLCICCPEAVGLVQLRNR